jgi:hypothetical protein
MIWPSGEQGLREGPSVETSGCSCLHEPKVLLVRARPVVAITRKALGAAVPVCMSQGAMQ